MKLWGLVAIISSLTVGAIIGIVLADYWAWRVRQG